MRVTAPQVTVLCSQSWGPRLSTIFGNWQDLRAILGSKPYPDLCNTKGCSQLLGAAHIPRVMAPSLHLQSQKCLVSPLSCLASLPPPLWSHLSPCLSFSLLPLTSARNSSLLSKVHMIRLDPLT